VNLKESEHPGVDYLCLEATASMADALASAGLPSSLGRSKAAACRDPGLGPKASTLGLNLSMLDNEGPGAQMGGRPLQIIPYPQGSLVLASLVNLTIAAAARPTRPPARVYVRRAAFDQLTDSCGAERLQGLDLAPRASGPDTALTHLQACLQECIQEGAKVSGELVNHLVQAIHCHIARVYGGIIFRDPLIKGGLARWQLRLAVEQLDNSLDCGRPPLAQIARRCELSVNHFSRAFTRSTGLSPSRWSRRRRMERAKLLLRSTTRSLTDISQACGFTDQSHFSHQFSVATGTTPTRWREQHYDDHGRIP
jgi:AraC family transcriptional regulator